MLEMDEKLKAKSKAIQKKVYCISFHHDEMPAFQERVFDNAEELAERCLGLQPDLRCWHTDFS